MVIQRRIDESQRLLSRFSTAFEYLFENYATLMPLCENFVGCYVTIHLYIPHVYDVRQPFSGFEKPIQKFYSYSLDDI